MKKVITSLAIVCSVLFFSCSKDEPTNPETGSDAIMKVDVVYTGSLDKFEETLTLQVVSKKSNTLKFLEQDLDKENPSPDVVWFIKPLSSLVPSSTYTTSDKITMLTVAGVITPKEINPAGTEEVAATIKIYSNNKLIETKNVIAKVDKAYTFSFPVPAK